MPTAYNLTRSDAVYRHGAFSSGLIKAGYEIGKGAPQGKPGDVLLIWSRYGNYHEQATRFEAAGGTVVVTENGYFGPGGISPHSMDPRTIYALGLGAHNDAGAVPTGGPERWAALDVDLAPWRTSGEHILVCPNRSFGIPERMMPPAWGSDVCKRLAKLTRREIRLRPHPGNSPPKKPLADDLAGAHACVIWSSSAGVHALIAGIPVICEAPYWICREASFLSGLRYIDEMEPPRPEDDCIRLTALERLAWGQWHIDEIIDGTAFRALLA